MPQLRQPYGVQVLPQSFANQQSLVDEALYSGAVIGAGSAVKLTLFSQSTADVGQQFTNMPTRGLLPANWPYHYTDSMGLLLTPGPILAADWDEFFDNATYVYSYAQAPIKYGDLKELIDSPGEFHMAPAVAASTTFASSDVVMLNHKMLPVDPIETIEAGINFDFTIQINTAAGIANFANTRLYIFLFGRTQKLVAG